LHPTYFPVIVVAQPFSTLAAMGNSSPDIDAEKNAGEYTQLINTTVQTFGWKNVTVTVKDRNTKQPKDILHDVNGFIKAGEQLRRTLLNACLIEVQAKCLL
jgi:hypothetical protein